FEHCFRRLDPALAITWQAHDGERIVADQVLCELAGPARALLTGERSALNFLQLLSGVATKTRQYADLIAGTQAQVVDTRKTIPGLRLAQKYAVRCGGGVNHRRDLAAAVLIKENHLSFYRTDRDRRDLARRVAAARRRGRTVEMECRNRAEIRWGLSVGADILLLDNFSAAALPAVVRWTRAEARRRGAPVPRLEVSGGVTLPVIGRLARSGVDRVSIGRLTHSAPALDFNMDVEIQ
ncbi:MAG TPA: carboxylating nicotinate-nucleotide diphosphorylase, partial [Elusimicrobiota bacterium]|nr:carboxylating nicotinate-nucleotide diphosphorylase [Elusimicrobiota bacterium]